MWAISLKLPDSNGNRHRPAERRAKPDSRRSWSDATDTSVDTANANFDFSKRIPELDGLRGVAILLVLLYHYIACYVAKDVGQGLLGTFLRPFDIGWCGVDLFFVLSGFLIGGILLDARGSRNYFQVFYTRRVCRIFPVYFGFLLVVSAASVVGIDPAIPWKFSTLFLQNFWLAAHNDVWRSTLVMNPTWSLAVEEQFYLTLPALIWFLPPRHLPKVLAGGILAAPLIRTALFLWVPGSEVSTYVLLPCRMDALLIGVATAWALRLPGAQEFLRSRRSELWTAIEVLTVVSALYFLRGTQNSLLMNLVLYDSLALLFACFIVAALIDNGVRKALNTGWLKGLGTIAYGTYLIHVLVVQVFILEFPRLGAFATMLIGAAVTIAVAKASWEFFERPLVKFGHRVSYDRAQEPIAPNAIAVSTLS